MGGGGGWGCGFKVKITLIYMYFQILMNVLPYLVYMVAHAEIYLVASCVSVHLNGLGNTVRMVSEHVGSRFYNLSEGCIHSQTCLKRPLKETQRLGA